MTDYSWLDAIRAVGFDLDGTLYHSGEEFGEWVDQALTEVVSGHLNKSAKEAMKRFKEIKQRLNSTTLALTEIGLEGEKVFQELFDKAPLERFIKPNPELVELVGQLAGGRDLFIISNGTLRQVLRKLKLIGLDEAWFEPIIACYDYEGWIKPNPDSFEYVIEKLQLRPEQILFIGDRDATDIEGAQRVGMKTMFVYGKSELADINVPTIEEAVELLLS